MLRAYYAINKYQQLLFLWSARATPLRFHKDLRRFIAERYFFEIFNSLEDEMFCTQVHPRYKEEEREMLTHLNTQPTICYCENFAEKFSQMFELTTLIMLSFLKNKKHVMLLSNNQNEFEKKITTLDCDNLRYFHNQTINSDFRITTPLIGANIYVVFGFVIPKEKFFRLFTSMFQLTNSLFFWITPEQDDLIISLSNLCDEKGRKSFSYIKM
jgi:hypothetical protein